MGFEGEEQDFKDVVYVIMKPVQLFDDKYLKYCMPT